MIAKSWRILCVVIFLLTLAGRSLDVSAQAPEPKFRMGDPLVIRADSNPSALHILAPARLALRRNAGSNIIVDFMPAGSDNCIQFPADAQVAYQYAADIWAGLLNVPVPLHISACWMPLGPGILGSAGPLLVDGFPGQPVANTYYPLALANNYAGHDLSASKEIISSFNSQFSSWYFGTDGNPGSGSYDFVSVALHEIGHGLGFIGLIKVSGGLGINTYLAIYDRFTKDNSGVLLAAYPDNSAALASVLTSAVFFGGSQAVSANGGQMVPLYAPGGWQPGSSYSHLGLSYDSTANGLMTYSLSNGEVIHDPGPVTIGILSDLGWQTAVDVTTWTSLHELSLPVVMR